MIEGEDENPVDVAFRIVNGLLRQLAVRYVTALSIERGSFASEPFAIEKATIDFWSDFADGVYELVIVEDDSLILELVQGRAARRRAKKRNRLMYELWVRSQDEGKGFA